MKKSVANVFLIVIAIILIVLTIMIVNDRGRSSGSGSWGITIDQAHETFNSTFSRYEGTQKGSTIKTLLFSLSTNNETQKNIDGHVIEVTFIDENGYYLLKDTTDNTSISECREYIVSSHKYEVTVTAVDCEGYFSAIEIKAVN